LEEFREAERQRSQEQGERVLQGQERQQQRQAQAGVLLFAYGKCSAATRQLLEQGVDCTGHSCFVTSWCVSNLQVVASIVFCQIA
jgi:hypothetical protein